MKVRNMMREDAEDVLKMMRVFYDSPAVLTKSSDQVLKKDIQDCIGDCPFVEGYVFDDNGIVAGYAMLAKSYSTEFGGLCVWIEDLYIRPEYRQHGIADLFFTELEKMYKEKAVRFRLEAEEENEHAMHVYKKNGFSKLPYVQMTKEF